MHDSNANPIDKLPKSNFGSTQQAMNLQTDKTPWYASIRVKVLLVAFVPMLFAIALSFHLIEESSEAYSDTTQLKSFVELSIRASNHLHETQIERGITSLFIGSGGKEFVGELQAQRQKTDRAWKVLNSHLVEFHPHASTPMIEGLIVKVSDELTRFSSHRALVDSLDLTIDEGEVFYTDHNTTILSLISMQSMLNQDPRLALRSTAFSDFLHGKENAGLERAVMSSSLSKDRLNTQDIKRLGLFILEQESYFSKYLQYSTPDQASAYRAMKAHPCFNQVQLMRDVLFQEGRIEPKDILWSARLDTIQVQQWLTDIGVTRAQDGLDDGFDLAEQYADDFHLQMDTLLSMTSDAEDRISHITTTFDEFYANGILMANQYISNGTAAGNQAMAEFDQYAEEINRELIELDTIMVLRSGFGIDPAVWFQAATTKINLMRELELVISSDLLKHITELQKAKKANSIFHLWTTALVTCLVLSIVIVLGKKISTPIVELARLAESITQGNYSQALHVHSNDEIGRLSKSFNRMSSSLNTSFENYKTQQAILEATLLDSQNKNTAINEHVYVSMTDIRGDITYANDKFVQISGYSRDELIGQNHRLINSGEHDKEFFRNMWKTISSKNIWNGDVKNRAKDGTYYWVNATIVPFRDSSGKITHYFAIRTDISGTKFANEQAEVANKELQAQAEELISQKEDLNALNSSLKEVSLRAEKSTIAAQAADQSKSEFLANMSHEIRTPMTAILGFAETISENVELPENIESISIVQKNGEHLLNIINDILDISKLDAGKMTTEIIQVNPVSLVSDVVDLVKIRAQAKGLSLDVILEDGIPHLIHTDPTRLLQILTNLIGNAIKFTEHGGVKIIASYNSSNDESSMCFDIADTGIGLTEKQVSNLFQPFVQADSSTTRQFGGTGLGLTISKRFTELLGGELTIASTTHGKGTTFRATISAGEVVHFESASTASTTQHLVNEKPTTVSQTDLTGYRILLAEDGPDNQKLITFVLRKSGAEVFVAENGKIALDTALENLHKGTPFHCILMDMQMPVMSGYEATSELREENYTGPIIALTAHEMTGDREKCMNAGCDDFANKPINRKELIALIIEHNERKSKAA